MSKSPKKRSDRTRRQTVGELRELQRLVASALMRPLTKGQRMQPRWSDGRATADVVGTFIKPNDRLTSFQRLEIYNRQYWFRLIDCFYDDYPGLRAVLGQDLFHQLAVAYLTEYPSSSFSLRNLGRRLVAFIKSEPSLTAPHCELALDLARLEWAHIEAFDNAASLPVTVEDLQGRTPAEIHLGLQPYVTLLQLNYPLDDYLISVRRETGLRSEASNAMEDTEEHSQIRAWQPPPRKPIRLAVHRYRNTVHYKRLNRVQFQLLNSLAAGESLETALASIPPAASPQIEKWFKNWSALGWFWLRTKRLNRE
jgi:hypothetical protein